MQSGRGIVDMIKDDRRIGKPYMGIAVDCKNGKLSVFEHLYTLEELEIGGVYKFVILDIPAGEEEIIEVKYSEPAISVTKMKSWIYESPVFDMISIESVKTDELHVKNEGENAEQIDSY
jgi:hypothetical protein